MNLRKAITIGGALAVCGTFALVSTATAAFHFTKIREISGDPGGNNESYVELQMYTAGNNQIIGHNFFCYDAAGTITDMYDVTADPPPPGTPRTPAPSEPSWSATATCWVGATLTSTPTAALEAPRWALSVSRPWTASPGWRGVHGRGQSAGRHDPVPGAAAQHRQW